MKDDLHFLQLWDLYSPLLTTTQREITDLYFNYDLSLGEIAEQKGVSRQSVSDCLSKCRKQLETYEEKLKFLSALNDLSQEYSHYATVVGRWLEEQRQAFPERSAELDGLQTQLQTVRKEFGEERTDTDGGAIYGKVIRGDEELE